MNRLQTLLVVTCAAIAVAACEPSLVGTIPPRTASPSQSSASPVAGSAGGSSAASGAGAPSAGQAIVSSSASAILVNGLGPVLKTPTFELPGPVTMKLSTCGSNGTFPFVWLYTQFNA